jgi:hypothetical protein
MINEKENEGCKVTKIEFIVEELSPIQNFRLIFLVLILLFGTFFLNIFVSLFFKVNYTNSGSTVLA